MKTIACSICILLAAILPAEARTPANTIPSQTASQSNIRSKLETIVIPEIVFRDAPIVDVLKFLDAASIEQDQDKVGINILLMDPDNKTKLTMTMRKVSLKSVLNLVAQMANLTVTIEDGAVTLRKPVLKKDAPKEELAAPVYPPPHFGHGPQAQKTRGK